MELVVITGVSRGLGNAMAREFAGMGRFVVAGCGRSKDLLAELQCELGSKHLVSSVDITVDSQVKDWSHDVISRYGPPTYLINNAGLLTIKDKRDHQQQIWNVSEPEFSSVIDANLKGTVNVLRHFVPGMIQNGYGLIVNFISRWAKEIEQMELRADMSSMGPYMASKCGIVGLTRSLRVGLELKALQEGPSFRGIRAIDFDPDTVETNMWVQAAFQNQQPSSKNPKEWAKLKVPEIIANLREYTPKERDALLALYVKDQRPNIT